MASMARDFAGPLGLSQCPGKVPNLTKLMISVTPSNIYHDCLVIEYWVKDHRFIIIIMISMIIHQHHNQHHQHDHMIIIIFIINKYTVILL